MQECSWAGCAFGCLRLLLCLCNASNMLPRDRSLRRECAPNTCDRDTFGPIPQPHGPRPDRIRMVFRAPPTCPTSLASFLRAAGCQRHTEWAEELCLLKGVEPPMFFLIAVCVCVYVCINCTYIYICYTYIQHAHTHTHNYLITSCHNYIYTYTHAHTHIYTYIYICI